jgi:hypothetical protein
MEDDAQYGWRSAMPSFWQVFTAIHGCGCRAKAVVPEMAAVAQHGSMFVTPELHVLSNVETREGLQGPGAAEDDVVAKNSSSSMASMANLANVHTDMGMPTESVQEMLSPRPEVQPQAFGLSSYNMQYLSPKLMLLYSPPRDGHALLATSAWDQVHGGSWTGRAMGAAEVMAIGVASYFGWQQRAQGDLMLDWSSLPMTMGLRAMGLASPQF